MFREKAHDEGDKTVFGKTGAFTGEDIIDALLDKKETAVYISRKIYRFFVNDQVDEQRVSEMADVFYNSHYDIGGLMKYLFTSDWFYDSRNIGAKIKSPVDLIAGIHRLVPVTYENKEGLLVLQRALGQALFYPPNVSGWAGGKNWIDSSSLMYRLKTPSILLNYGIIEVEPKEDMLDDKGKQMMEHKMEEIAKQQGKGPVLSKIKSQPDWDSVLKSIPHKMTQEELISAVLLPEKLSPALLSNIPALTDSNHKEFILELLSAPEYQMG